MRYIKSIMFACLTVSFIAESASGQNTNRNYNGSLLIGRNANSAGIAPINEFKQRINGNVLSLKNTNDPVMTIARSLNNSQETSLNSSALQPGTDTVATNKDTTKWVNVAYQKIDSRDKIGAISVLNPGDFMNKDYTSSVSSGISGRVSGLMRSPDGSMLNNIWGLENALVLVDGIPRSMSDVRLDEVAQITVLKGVNAVALYGSYAANGVILITTKRGEVGKRDINVRLNQGMETPKLYPKYLSSGEYMTLYNEARTNDGLAPFFDNATISNTQSGNNIYRYPSIDYYSSKYLQNHVNNTDLDAEFSGGNKTAQFYSNIGWMNNSTLINLGEGAKEKDLRFNARGNVDLKINKYLSSSIDISTVVGNSRRGLGDYWNEAATILPNKYSPLLPVSMINPDSVDAVTLAQNSRNIIDGKYILGGSQEYLSNPIADLYVGGHQTSVNQLLELTNGINFDLNSIVKGLSFHTIFNADYYNSYVEYINNDYSVYYPTWDSIPGSNVIESLEKFGFDARPGKQNILSNRQQQIRNLGFSLYFSYQRTFNKVNNFSAILLGTGNSISKSGIYQPATNTNLGLKLAYNYDHRYWADFTGALVNSTKLPANSRRAISPTVSLGWLVSSEDFLKDSRNIDFLKLSVSAGILNTDTLITNYYIYDNTYTSQAYFSWDDNLYYNQASTALQGGNPNLTYAKRKEINATVDGLFFNNLLSLETNFFLTRMADIPTQRFSEYPSYFSTFVPYTNYNTNQYTGIDFMLNFDKKFGDLEFNLGLYGIYANSKVIKQDELYTNSYQDRVGKPVDAIFGLVNKGFFTDQTDINNSPKQAFGEIMPGDIKYVDQNNDGVVDQNDEVQIGRWSSPFNYSLNFSVTYKALTLFVQGTGSKGGDGVKSGNYYWVDGDKKYSAVVLNRWTDATKNTATYPRLSSQTNSNNFRYSDFWIYKTDRFDLSRIQLSYNLSKKVLQNSFIRGLGIYINGANLFTFSKSKDILNLNVGRAPQMRYYSVGIRANF